MGEHVTKKAMHYRCEECHCMKLMWLEKGLEESGEGHKSVPYIIGCPECGGHMKHIWWDRDIRMKEYSPIVEAEGMNYFKNAKGSDCGVPIFASKGKNS